MTVLRQRMLDDMRIRNLAAETQTSYLRQVAKFARYYGQSPELLGPEDIRTYQLHLLDDRQLAPTSVAGTVAALRFLYQVTLKRDWAVEALPMPKRGETLPVILSPEEVVRFLDGVARLKHRMILTTCYAAGLRLSEALRSRSPTSTVTGWSCMSHRAKALVTATSCSHRRCSSSCGPGGESSGRPSGSSRGGSPGSRCRRGPSSGRVASPGIAVGWASR